MQNLKSNNSTNDILLKLVRLGIGTSKDARFSDHLEWSSIKSLAKKQGVSAVVIDGILEIWKQNVNIALPEELLLTKWKGEVVQRYEFRYELYRRAIAELAGFYNDHGYKMMILKGFACSLNWPRPEHRPCGDIDVWMFGMQKDSDSILSKEMGVVIDNSHHHHTIFGWHDFVVENHYDFVNVFDYKSSRELEEIFKELGKDDSHYVEVYGEKVYLPSSNLHTLFLIRHMIAHFTSTSLSLRQLLDWAFFVANHRNEVDWKWIHEILNKYNMKEIYNCFNAICVEDLGFDTSVFKGVIYNPELKRKVLNDILNPKYGTEEPDGIFKRLIYKYKRWRSNSWKREVCYEGSDWSAFWRGFWAHLIKPASI